MSFEGKKLLFYNDDGTLAVVTPNPNFHGTREEMIAVSIPDGKQHFEVNDSDMVNDRHFRNAWRYDDSIGEVVVDITKAKEIQKDYWREKRYSAFQDNDRQFMIAMQQENEDELAKARARAQELRDVTNYDISNIEDPDELKGTIPDALKDYS